MGRTRRRLEAGERIARWWRLRGLVASLGLLPLGVAAAATPELAWSGVDRCLVERVESRLRAYIGADATTPPIRVALRGWRARGRWFVELELDTPEGRRRRRLDDEHCEELAEAVAFVIAVAADPSLVAPPPRSPPPAASPPAASPPAASPPAASPPAASPPAALPPSASPASVVPASPVPDSPVPVVPTPPVPAGVASAPQARPILPPPRVDEPAPSARAPAASVTTRRLRGALRATFGIDGVGLPRVGAHLSLTAALFGAGWRTEVVGAYRPPYAADDPGTSLRARISLWSLGARGCGVPRVSRVVELPLCGGVEAGQVLGSASGFSGATSGTLPWVALTAQAAVVWVPWPRLALWSGPELAVPLSRGTFFVENLPFSQRVGPVAVRGLVGVEVRFP